LKRTPDKVGSMHRKPRKRGPDIWIWRRRVPDAMGIERNLSVIIGPVTELPTEKHAWAASQEQRQALMEQACGVTLANLMERYKVEGLEVRHSTRSSCLSRINCHIIPYWGDLAITNSSHWRWKGNLTASQCPRRQSCISRHRCTICSSSQ
jgi:hypothetical protein